MQRNVKVNDLLLEEKDTVAQPQPLTNTIELATEVFPESKAYELRLLEPIGYHSDEVDPKLAGYQWYGLYKTDSNTFYLAKTAIKTKRVYDEIIDNEGKKTGWQIKTTGKDTAIILITGMQFIERNVDVITVGKNIEPGQKRKVSYDGTTYIFYATGETQANRLHLIQNYHLYVKAVINGKAYKQLLFAAKGFIESMPYIHFISDVDADAIPDVIMDTSCDENTARLTLYLSSPVFPTSLLKAMGMQVSVGC